MKILVYGSVNIDRTYRVAHVNLPGETQASLGISISAGGKGANQAAAIAKAGIPTYFSGKIGPDGIWVKDLLASYGVKTDHLLETGSHTGEALIQLDDNGQNSILLSAGGNGEICEQEIGDVLTHFSPGDWLVCQNEISCLSSLMTMAQEKGMRICFNPSPFTATLLNLPVQACDLVILNEIEGASMAGIVDADYNRVLNALTSKYPTVEFVLTVGKAGALYGKGSVRAKGEILDLPIVDTTGAGDTFTGYYLVSRVTKCLDPEESLGMACKAASLAVNRKGAMVAMPMAQEVFG